MCDVIFFYGFCFFYVFFLLWIWLVCCYNNVLWPSTLGNTAALRYWNCTHAKYQNATMPQRSRSKKNDKIICDYYDIPYTHDVIHAKYNEDAGKCWRRGRLGAVRWWWLTRWEREERGGGSAEEGWLSSILPNSVVVWWKGKLQRRRWVWVGPGGWVVWRPNPGGIKNLKKNRMCILATGNRNERDTPPSVWEGKTERIKKTFKRKIQQALGLHGEKWMGEKEEKKMSKEMKE